MINAKTATWEERMLANVKEYMIHPGVQILAVGEGMLKWRHMYNFNVMLSTKTPLTRHIQVSMLTERDPEASYVGQLRDEDSIWYIQYKNV